MYQKPYFFYFLDKNYEVQINYFANKNKVIFVATIIVVNLKGNDATQLVKNFNKFLSKQAELYLCSRATLLAKTMNLSYQQLKFRVMRSVNEEFVILTSKKLF
ncbi:YgjP-like metallopeptidase domain-containing protein [Spiroplasma endosymbiont of Agriotes lineatus]|uniref:YgjP-like metallopeptidase domain-containing protein n=1 Tax=Spiroplasma endosymbiont of Agriotes lineatus TaxID=3077930 RepID=UPI0030D0EF2C